MELELFLDKGKTILQIIKLGMCRKVDKNFVSTGIKEFDIAMDGGLRAGELVVISGQTGHGKTTFAQTLTCNMSNRVIPTMWFSYEMMDYYLADIFKKMGQTIESPIYSPVQLVDGTLQFIEQEINEAMADNFIGCKVVFVDHLHYLIPLTSSQNNSSLAIGGIVRGLKQLAIRKGIVIVLIAHTKKIYQDEELDLSSVRDSSLVCQEADYVFLVEREKRKKDNYKAMAEKEKFEFGTDWLNTTIVKIAKNRRTGKMFQLQFVFQNNVLIPVTNIYNQDEFKNNTTI